MLPSIIWYVMINEIKNKNSLDTMVRCGNGVDSFDGFDGWCD